MCCFHCTHTTHGQAKAATFYVLKYVVKDGNYLGNVLSLILHADKHISEYPSVAANAGTRVRNAQYLMTRIINCVNGESEHSAPTAAVALLGYPSNVYSSGFALCFILPAVGYVQHLIKDGAVYDGADDDDELDDDGAMLAITGGDDEQRHLAEQIDTVAIDDVGAGDFDLDNGDAETFGVTKREDDEAEADVDDDDVEQPPQSDDDDADADDPLQLAGNNDDGMQHFHAQHLAYRYRGDALKHFTLFEFCGCVALKLGAADTAAVAPWRGRRANASYPLDARHPQASTHCLVLKAKLDVPMLAGGGAPPHPGPRRMDPAWRRRAEVFAAYTIVLHAPWELESGVPPMALTFSSLLRYVRRLSTSGSYVDRARLFWMRCLSQV